MLNSILMEIPLATVDPSMMDIVFENLITNSIKYSDSNKNIEIDFKNNSRISYLFH